MPVFYDGRELGVSAIWWEILLLSREDEAVHPILPYSRNMHNHFKSLTVHREYLAESSYQYCSTNLEWKFIYVGSAEDETYDQLLESVLVRPVNVGNYRFVFEADPPDPSKIREKDIIGVIVLLLTCSYLGQEFVRVGYYVNGDYEEEQLKEEPPQKVLVDKVQRNILADKPRFTKFPINFHPENTE
ncbi:hypothetical protein LguiB_015063 [Lonicera macranthoides]